ncbi:nucleotide disphospho-sugar-binding domain-containing protein [Streptomyces sp. NPDC059063]|uniref:nucleotide disphospho-sugar-binding domain-containing protein n=1 Tax=unclassified Streptomyces TaxID=2593676 RepID=UPI003698F8FD
MRVLFSVAPFTAHLYPSVPLAWALQSAGHEVRLAGNTSMAERITAAGLTAVRLGEAATAPPSFPQEERDRFTEALGFEPGSDHGLLWESVAPYVALNVTRYHPDAEGRQGLADNLVEFARDWRPDLVIWDPASPIGSVAARESGAASARLMWGPDYFGLAQWRLAERLSRGDIRTHPLADLMAPVFRRFGYDFSEDMLLGDLTVDPIPRQLPRPEGHRTLPMRWVPYTGSAPVPDWLVQPPSRPRVCLSLGITARTVFAGRDERIVAVLEAVADMDVEVVATVNADQLGEDMKVPDNVRILDYVPLTQVMPTCSAIIHHGGFGTLFAAAACQVPQMIIKENIGSALCSAPYLESRGAGVALPVEGLTAAQVGGELSRMLTEPSFRQGAAAVYADMTAAPGPGEIVPILERLAGQYRTRD